MEGLSTELLRAFREDHAVLGGAFANLAAALRQGNWRRARSLAAAIDREAGAHIAFEEADFYPQLQAILGKETVSRLYGEHQIARALIGGLQALPEDQEPKRSVISAMLEDAMRMETHIADCGDLFQALAHLSTEEQDSLLEKLRSWRKQRPAWHEIELPDESVPEKPNLAT